MTGYQVMPRLTPDEYAELEASIVSVGVQVPITVGPDGTIIDGHHRDEIARKHDLHCPRVTARGDAAMLRGLAFSLNLHRRHLSREQRRELIAASLRSDPQLSNREHARRTGAHKNTVQAVREEAEESGQIAHFSERIDPRTGNRSQPATQPPRPAPEPLAPGFNPGDLDALNAKPEPATPKRRPITDQARDAGWELRKAVERLERIADDDRFTANKSKVAPHLRGHLTNAIEVCQDLLDRINTHQGA